MPASEQEGKGVQGALADDDMGAREAILVFQRQGSRETAQAYRGWVGRGRSASRRSCRAPGRVLGGGLRESVVVS